MFVGALVFEIVRDIVYPKLKQTLYSIYKKLPSLTPSGKAYPMRVTIREPDLEVSYQLPERLSDVAFGEALGSISIHFASVKGESDDRRMFTFDAEAKNWVSGLAENESEPP